MFSSSRSLRIYHLFCLYHLHYLLVWYLSHWRKQCNSRGVFPIISNSYANPVVTHTKIAFKLFNSASVEYTLLATEWNIFLTIYVIPSRFPLNILSFFCQGCQSQFLWANIPRMCSWRRKRVYFYQILEKQGCMGAKHARTCAGFTQWGTEKFTFCISWSIFTFQINFPPTNSPNRLARFDT